MSRTVTARPPLGFCFGTGPTQATSAVASAETAAKDRIEPPTGLIPVLAHQSPIENADLIAQRFELDAERRQASADKARTASILGDIDARDQSVERLRPLGATMPSSARCALIALGTRQLTHEEMSRTLHQEAGLLLSCLARAAFMTMKAGLVVTPSALSNR